MDKAKVIPYCRPTHIGDSIGFIIKKKDYILRSNTYYRIIIQEVEKC